MNWKSESLWSAILGGVVAVLGGIGLITADESADLAANALSAGTGVAGLMQCVIGIVSRVKASKLKGE